MYLLDTNVVSAQRRPERNRAVSQWLLGQSPDDLYISVITIGEIEYGIARQRRTQAGSAARLEDWLESVRTSFGSRILPLDEASARRWGHLHAELGYTNSDLLIAATALVHGFTVVTRNVRHFEPTGVRVINPFDNPVE